MKTITGSWVNPDGTPVAFGRVFFGLSQDAVAVGTSQVAPSLVSFTLTAAGAIPANTQIFANDELTPVNTTYTVSVLAQGGGLVWGAESLSLSGASPININTLVPTSTSGGVVFSGAVLLTPTGGLNQTISGPLTITGLTNSGNETIAGTLGVAGVATALSFVGGSAASPNAFGNTQISSFTAANALTLVGTNALTTTGSATVGNLTVTGTCTGCSSGAGTVTSFSANDLSPLFTTTEATPTTTPVLSFALTNAAANTVFGNATGGSTTPSYGAVVQGQVTNGYVDLTTAQGIGGRKAFSNLEDILFVDRYGNGTTTGIAGAITTAGVVNKTILAVPSTYATTESIPGSVAQWKGAGPGTSAAQGGNTTANLTFIDNRFGRYFTALDPKGDSALINTNYAAWQNYNVNYIAGPSGLVNNNRTLLGLNLNALDGGFNFNANGFVNKEAYANIDSRQTSFTPGQKYGITSFNTNYSVGDQVGIFSQNVCFGGFTAAGDEGCEAIDAEAYQGNVEYTGTISGASTGATSLTVAPTTGATTQGAGRFLIDITQITNAGTISAITFTNSTTPVAITGVGTSFGVSNVNTTLGTAVNPPGIVTVTPASMTNITTAISLCISDRFEFEQVVPTATTGTTFTANFRYPHLNTALVTAGGACGKFIEFVADRATTAKFGATTFPSTGGNVGTQGNVINTLHYAIPMIRSTSNTAADIWLINPNSGYAAYRGQWTAGGVNTYATYPGAQVTSVQGATASCINNSTCGTGNINNTLILEPNKVAWANGDTVALPLYPFMNVSIGQMVVQNFFPQAGGANAADLAIASYGIRQLNDNLIAVNNNTPAALYTTGGGTLQPPNLFSANGPFKRGFTFPVVTPTSCILCVSDSTNVSTIFNNELLADTVIYNPTTRIFQLGPGSAQISTADTRVSFGGAGLVANVAAWFNNGSASSAGLTISGPATQNNGIFPFSVNAGGIPMFYTQNSGGGTSYVDVVNNSTPLIGFSGNQVTQTWQLSSAAGTLSLTEGATPAGVASQSIIGSDSGDHLLKYNPNNTGEQHVPQLYTLTAQYTNSTTSFTTVGTPNIAFAVKANTKYTATCHLYYQAAATGGLNIEFTGPASPTAVVYSLTEPIALGTIDNSVATAFAASLGNIVTTAATNFDAVVSFSLINGANAGTVTLLAKSSAAVQLQIQAGSFCRIQ